MSAGGGRTSMTRPRALAEELKALLFETTRRPSRTSTPPAGDDHRLADYGRRQHGRINARIGRQYNHPILATSADMRAHQTSHWLIPPRDVRDSDRRSAGLLSGALVRFTRARIVPAVRRATLWAERHNLP